MTSPRFYLLDGSTVSTLRQARKLGAVPSVTTILSVYPKPWLVNYQIKSTLEAALTLPAKAGESLDQFAERVTIDAEAKSRIGRDRGDRAHKAILFNDPSLGDDILPVLTAWREWQSEHERTVWVEQVLHGKGYAGRADRLMLDPDSKEYFLDDFKVRSTARIYDEDRLQLAAYLEALPLEQWIYTVPRSICIQADGNNIVVREWLDDEMADSFAAFRQCLDLWRTVNNYNPQNL